MSIQFNLSGFNCMVTGGTKGIGRATVKLLLQSKAKVYTCSRNKKELDDFIHSKTEKGYKIYGTVCDVSKAKDRENLVEKVNEKFDGKLDIFVNNVGLLIKKASIEHTYEDVQNILATNIESGFEFSKMLYPMLKASDKGASIVFISAASGGPRTMHISSVQSMTKAALNQLSAHLACEWGRDGIRVNAVAPGAIITPLNRRLIIKNKDNYNEMIKNLALGRYGETDEVANAIIFLSSPASSFITGCHLNVDGGYSRHGVFFNDQS